MQLIETIFFWAKLDPNRKALVQPEMITTYAGLADAIRAISARIEQLPLPRDEPVAISIENPTYFVAAVFALLHSGYDVALVNPTLFPLLRGAGVRNLIYDTQPLATGGGASIRFEMSWLQTPVATTMTSPAQKDPHLLFFTSGSTGKPKNVVHGARAHGERLKNPFSVPAGPYGKALVLPGLSSTFGFYRVCEVLNFGKTVFFAPESDSALSLINIFEIDLIIGSVAQILQLVDAKKRNPSSRVESLRAIVGGGGKIGDAAIAAVRTHLCRNYIKHYGSTEGGAVALGSYDSVQGIPDAVGFLLPWAEVQIIREDGTQASPGEEGIIRYRTPPLLGNLGGAGSAVLSNIQDGWFYPGDIGAVTANGVLRLVGRTTDVINRGGVKIAGSKIEEFLETLPQIKEAAACGVIHTSGIEEIWIAIIAEGPFDTEDIKKLMQASEELRIEPDEVFLMQEFPRGTLGKVQKERLKEQMIKLKEGL